MKFEKSTNHLLKETLYHGVHQSGLPVYVLEKKEFDKFYAIISTQYGSNDVEFEYQGRNINVPDGVAHFLEHKMFEQPDGSNAFDKFSKYGANANAYTSFNNTAYLFQSTGYFYESLDHLLSYVFSPHFTEENVAKEQGIIGQEIRMYDDDPEWRVFFNMLRGMYVNHPINRDIAGTVESISHITKDLLYDCYHTFYHPQNMVLFLAGNIDISALGEILDRNVLVREEPFGAISKAVFEPDEIAKPLVKQTLSVSIPMFSCGYKDVAGQEKGQDLARKNLLTTIVTKMFLGESAPLYERLYQEGLINDAFMDDVTINRDYSFIQFGGESKDPVRVGELILEEAARLKKEGLCKESFERLKKYFYGKYVKAFNHIEAVGNAFCSNYFLNIGLFDFLSVYESLTFEDAKNRFDQLFDKQKFVMSIIEPPVN